jgi:hypothetical protein
VAVSFHPEALVALPAFPLGVLPVALQVFVPAAPVAAALAWQVEESLVLPARLGGPQERAC